MLAETTRDYPRGIIILLRKISNLHRVQSLTVPYNDNRNHAKKIVITFHG